MKIGSDTTKCRKRLRKGSNDNSNICGDDVDEDGSVLQSKEEIYESLATLIISALHTHLKTTLVHTGYQSIEAKKVDNEDDSSDMPGSVKSEGEDYISMQNYSNIVANCIEIGRALHHLGVCLGRQQRDGESLVVAVDRRNEVNAALSLEMLSYKNALDAYKAANFVITTAGNCALLNEQKKFRNEKLAKSIMGELEQEREASCNGSVG